MNRFVIDASIAVAWCFEDQKAPEAERVLDRMAAGGEALAPAIWPFEVANALRSAERSKRLTPVQTARFLERLLGFGILLEAPQMASVFDQVLSRARAHRLTVYDAAYLELAVRTGLPLATLDGALRKAARKLGVTLVEGHAVQ